jgi:hypothetical protein
MCTSLKRLLRSRLSRGCLLLLGAVVTIGGGHGLPQNLAAAQPPSYEWETLIPGPNHSLVQINKYVTVRIDTNSLGDVVGPAWKEEVFYYVKDDGTLGDAGVREQRAGFVYFTPDDPEKPGWLDDVANWGAPVDPEKWPVTQLQDGTRIAYPIVTDTNGRAWQIGSLRIAK